MQARINDQTRASYKSRLFMFRVNSHISFFKFQITSVLRALSFQKDPVYLNSFLKNNIIPRYANNLSSLLCLVYDGLMQRPPKEILSPSQVTSEEDTPLKYRKEALSSSKKAKSVEEAQ